jgi:hypothetical protein
MPERPLEKISLIGRCAGQIEVMIGIRDENAHVLGTAVLIAANNDHAVYSPRFTSGRRTGHSLSAAARPATSQPAHEKPSRYRTITKDATPLKHSPITAPSMIKNGRLSEWTSMPMALPSAAPKIDPTITTTTRLVFFRFMF